jgi:phenylacetate-coenzyme A ligase PaaK-like adenylate-forming protein
MNVDGVVMEFLDSDGVSPGERGEIVCTSLVNYSMPFI